MTLPFTLERQFTAQLKGDVGEIVIFDQIGSSLFGDGVTATDIKSQLDGFGDVRNITVHINSPGGVVDEGIAIYNLLHHHPARITVEIDGIAASAAAFIAMAGDRILMAKNATMLLHAARTAAASGTAEDLRRRAEEIERADNRIIDIFVSRSGQTREVIENLVGKEDTNLSAEEALALGLITEITPNKSIAAHATSWLKAQSDNPAPVERKQHTITGTQMKILDAIGCKTDEEAVSAFSEVKMFQNGVVSALGATSPVDAVSRLSVLTAKAAQVDTLQAELTAAKMAADEGLIVAQIKKLDDEKKLAPALQGWFRGLSASAREEYVANAPALVATSSPAPKALEASSVPLSSADEEVIKALNLNRATFMENRFNSMKAVH